MMRKLKVLMIVFGLILVFEGVGHLQPQAKAKWGMPEKVAVGSYELKLVWQKDLSKTFMEGTVIGSYGGIGNDVTISEGARYIGGNLHSQKKDGSEQKLIHGMFYLLDHKGDILWSKSLKAHKQSGVISKNGKTVLLNALIGKWNTEYFTYDVRGKLIGKGKDQLLAKLSGNGEYLLFFAEEIGMKAFLYNKNGKLSWKYVFKSENIAMARMTEQGDVILFDGNDILYRQPNGNILWRVKNPIFDHKKSIAPYTCIPHEVVFKIAANACADNPTIVAHCLNEKDFIHNKISLIDSKGDIVSEITGKYTDYYAISPDASIITGDFITSSDNFIWIWDTKKKSVSTIPKTTHVGPIYTDGRLTLYQGEYTKPQDTTGLDFASQLLIVDLETMDKAKIPSYCFSVSPEGKYLIIGLEDGRLTLYSIVKK